MPLSPFEVLAPYQNQTRLLDRWAQLQAVPAAQHPLPLEPQEPVQPAPADPQTHSASALEEPAATAQPEPDDDALAKSPDEPAVPVPSELITPPAQMRIQRRFYDQIIQKHTAAAARSVLTPATRRL